MLGLHKHVQLFPSFFKSPYWMPYFQPSSSTLHHSFFPFNRATRGLAITNFHGNFFVRSTDLLSLPNINPDAGFGMQVNIEEPLHNIRTACFQAALLYTSSKGEWGGNCAQVWKSNLKIKAGTTQPLLWMNLIFIFSSVLKIGKPTLFNRDVVYVREAHRKSQGAVI